MRLTTIIFIFTIFLSPVALAAKTWNYHDYKIIEYPKQGLSREILITKKGKAVFSAEEEDYSANLLLFKNKNPITKLTGDSPNVVIEYNGGGAHGDYNTTIIELGKEFRIIGKFYSSHIPLEFKQLDRDKALEVIIYDTYNYEWTCFGASGAGRVVLKYDGEKYLFNSKLTKKPPLSQTKLDKITNKINSEKYEDFNYPKSYGFYFNNSIRFIIDLIYSGNYPQVLEILDKTWPGNEKEKKQFLKELTELIKTREFGKEILTMNNIL